MTCPAPTLAPAPTPVLLVLLPAAGGLHLATQLSLGALQRRLGAAVRVLTLDESRHSDVVRSFGTPALPACVLMHRGVELWRQPGLPEGEAVAELLALVGGVGG